MHVRKMIRFRLTCSAGLLLLLPCALVYAESGALRLGHDVVPTFQAIELTVDADKPDYNGSVAVELDVRKATNTFRFQDRKSVV